KRGDRSMEKAGRTRQAGDRRRHVVAGRALYRRLGRHGLQRFVTSMLVHRPPRGRSVLFSTAGNELVLGVLGRNPRFCRDSRVGGILHHGVASFREIGTAASLHVTLASGDRLSVHLDRKTPAVAAKPDGGCIYERRGAAGHIWRDVFPSLVSRRGTGVGKPRPGTTRESAPVAAH